MRNHRSINGVIAYSLLVLLMNLFSGYGFSQVPSSVQYAALQFPWAGGLNSCQFCPIDLNNDGISDLLIFDRHGNRKLTFINHGTPNSIDYTFDPSYAPGLPELHDWVITTDYNCDGKMDIFTYGSGGVRVFENTSGNTLKFELVTDLLSSFYYTGKVGILVTSVDYPAIADIDNDGDLDLLTFFGLGSYVEYHQNLSMEKYGHCDSLDFRLADPCWGKFKESEGGNQIMLNTGCTDDKFHISHLTSPNSHFTFDIPAESTFHNPQQPFEVNRNTRHTGSTLLASDLNNDGLKDLILGDVDYPGLVALYNGGTMDTAYMVAQDTAFPASSLPVNLFSFPSASLIDIDNDGVKDLVASPFDPSLYTADNINSVWFYKNTGSDTQPNFTLYGKQVFQNEMIDFGSSSHPVLFDFDGDGLLDLFAGNYGTYDSSFYTEATLHSVYTSQIAWYKNTGTHSSPVFKYMTDDLAGISAMGLHGAYPAFADLNSDGFTDMVAGSSDGTLMLFTNTAAGSPVPSFHSPVMNWQGIDVGDYSAPQLFDLDKDNLPDLVIGEQNGNLNYYKNTGTAENPVFTFVTDSLGKVNVTNYNLSYNGFSTPCFSRHLNGTTFLVTGSEEGRIHLFENIDHNLDGKFTETAGLYEWLSSTPADTLFGWQTSPAIGHLTDNEGFDMITGNFSGGLNYISKRSPAEIIPGMPEGSSVKPGVLTVFPNPANETATITYSGSGHGLDIVIMNIYGQKILNLPFARQTLLYVAAFDPGIYLVRVGNETIRLAVSTR
jgi:hypothetical protein